MPTHLEDIVRSLNEEIARPDAKVAIVSDRGALDESSLLGTRDAYLRLARDLVALVAASERPFPADDEPGFWSDAANSAFHSFPTFSEPSIVGAYLFENHAELLDKMKELLGDRVVGWENDPDFAAPVQNDGLTSR